MENNNNGEETPLLAELSKDGTKIDKVAATVSVDELLDFYNVKFEHIVSDQGGQQAAETWKNKIVSAFMDGRLETLDDPEKGFCIIQNFSTGKSLTYKEYGFIASVQSARQKDGTTANIKLMSSLAGVMVDWFKTRTNCNGPDFRLTETVVLIFFF